jgi:hypothetical protein
VVCWWIRVFLHSERWRCQNPSAYVAAASRRDISFVTLALKVVTQNYGDFLDVIVLYFCPMSAIGTTAGNTVASCTLAMGEAPACVGGVNMVLETSIKNMSR